MQFRERRLIFLSTIYILSRNPPQPENNILNVTQYSSPDWRETLNQTTTRVNHN